MRLFLILNRPFELDDLLLRLLGLELAQLNLLGALFYQLDDLLLCFLLFLLHILQLVLQLIIQARQLILLLNRLDLELGILLRLVLRSTLGGSEFCLDGLDLFFRILFDLKLL